MHESHLASPTDAIDVLNSKGMCIVPGVRSQANFLEVCSILGSVVHHRDSEATGLTRIAARDKGSERPGYAAFSRASLELHTDRSTEDDPPNVLAMFYTRASGIGGELLCVDGRELHRTLREELPNVFRWTHEKRKLVYNDGSRSYAGAIFSEQDDGTTSLRFRADDNGFYPRAVWPHIELFLKMAHSLSMLMRPEDGDAVIMHNGWWLHGRTRYEGQRELLRMLLRGTSQIARGFVPHPTRAAFRASSDQPSVG